MNHLKSNTFLTLLAVAGFQETAFAAGKGAPTQDLLSSLPMLLVFFLGFYFLILRPQQKRQKAHKALIDGTSLGDEVSLTGGMMGRVAKLDEQVIHLEIADGVVIAASRSAISKVLPKGTLKSLKSSK